MKVRSEIVGWTITGLYLFCVTGVVFVKRSTIMSLGLNEVGDFLAGVFGPVAFLWLVLGYIQQGRELRTSSDALISQSEELARNVQQQMKLAELSERQLATQLEAAQRQEMQFKLMVEPNLQLYPSHGGISRGCSYRSFILGNIGVDAQKVVVIIARLDGTNFMVIEQQLLRNGGEAKFNCDFSEGIYGSFTVSVNYVNFVGLRGVQVFNVESRIGNSDIPDVKVTKII